MTVPNLAVDSPVDGSDRRFLEAIMRGDRSSGSAIAEEYLDRHKLLTNLYERLFRTTLYEIGILWEKHQISVATEHLSTAITAALMNEQYSRVERERSNGRRIVSTCLERESHQIGIQMVADVFEMHGWNVNNIGAGIPDDDLIEYLRESNPDALAVSLTVHARVPDLDKLLNLVRTVLPNLTVLIGGQGLRDSGPAVIERHPGTVYLPDLYAVEQYIESTSNAVTV